MKTKKTLFNIVFVVVMAIGVLLSDTPTAFGQAYLGKYDEPKPAFVKATPKKKVVTKKKVVKATPKKKVVTKKKVVKATPKKKTVVAKKMVNTNSNTAKTIGYYNKTDSQFYNKDNSKGFAFLNYTYKTTKFYGDGQVPWWTPYVFEWDTYKGHYLLEQASHAGQSMLQLKMGNKVYVDGKAYTIYKMDHGVPRLANSTFANLVNTREKNGGISFQTCDGVNSLKIYYAK